MLKSGLNSLNPEILAIFDCALEGIMIADVNYAVCYVNPAYTRMTGRKPEEEIGRVLRLETGTPFGPLREAIATRRPFYGQRYHPDGSKVELIVNASPLIVNEEVIGGVSFCQDITDILELTKKLSQRSRLVKSLTEKLEGLCGARYSFEHIVGESSAIRQMIKVARKAAAGSSTVLLTGESGTGKELFAHAMHHASPRERRPFLKVNCAAIPENLLESEFFGYEKGAFTGAVSRKMGLFERADGGTIFLDEIGDMSLSLQSKLLRFLQDGEVTRLGGWRPIEVDVRAVAATNRNLSQMIKEGSFREELYYRVNVVGINIPSLRERRQDIPLLVAHILRRVNRELGKQVQGVDKQAMDKLLAYHWPGNIRELENVLERAVNLVEGSLIPAEVILLPDIIAVAGKTEPASGEVKASADKDLALVCSLAAQEREHIRRAIAAYGTSLKGKRQAAKVLGISLATLYKRIKTLEVH